MYVVLLFIVLFGFLVIYQVLAKTLGLPALRLFDDYDPNALTHDSILGTLKQIGHPEFDGVCYGFTLNWGLAVAEGKESFFYRQLQQLRAHKKDLPAALERIEHKKQENEPLTVNEEVLLTLPKLCKRICIAQSPLDYKEKYGELVWQSDITPILKKIAPKDSTVSQVFYKTHTFSSRQQAIAYFNLLEKVGIDDDVAVVISTADHAMGFKHSGNLWRFININDLYEQDAERPYFEFNSAQLVQELYRVCTDGPLVKRLTVNTDFIALKPQQQLVKVLENQFPVFPLSNKTPYSDKVSFFAMAALQGDMPTVKKCLRAGWSIFSHRKMSDESPLLTAVYLGRREVVKAMVSAVPHRINHRRQKDWFTLLHIACRYGGSGIVEDLLKIKGIHIDPRDIKGRTPLMLACEATAVTTDPQLFTLLLGKGASLSIKDNDGLTALDHARENKNEIALQIMEARLKGQKSKQVSTYSSSSKAGFFRKGLQRVSSGLSESDLTGNEDIIFDV